MSRRRSRRRTRRRAYAALTTFAVLTWAWQLYPGWTLAVLLTAAAGMVAFRLRRRPTSCAEQVWLYRHYAIPVPTLTQAGEPIYYGITNCYNARCEQHANSSWWWPYVDQRLLTITGPYPDRDAALAAEAAAIRRDCPIGNTVHNRRYWQQAARRRRMQQALMLRAG